jgi:hypothetical protein
MVGSGHILILDTVPAFTSRNAGEVQKPLVLIDFLFRKNETCAQIWKIICTFLQSLLKFVCGDSFLRFYILFVL